jgi:hypothetical protein
MNEQLQTQSELDRDRTHPTFADARTIGTEDIEIDLDSTRSTFADAKAIDKDYIDLSGCLTHARFADAKAIGKDEIEIDLDSTRPTFADAKALIGDNIEIDLDSKSPGFGDAGSIGENYIDYGELVKKDVIFAKLDLADLKAGKNFLAIRHYCTPEGRQKSYYSTSITNRSTEQIRIDRFCTYTQNGDILVLHSITGGFFSAQQFREWYNLGDSIWIEPGDAVTDPNNHSNRGAHWVYFGTTASDKKFVASSPWLGDKPWWKLW